MNVLMRLILAGVGFIMIPTIGFAVLGLLVTLGAPIGLATDISIGVATGVAISVVVACIITWFHERT